ncbi:MAG: hypothetical protein GY803_08115 [Chloroflexi bacterium]|nr:hypothetical protein [Chloroflexota bacterium]
MTILEGATRQINNSNGSVVTAEMAMMEKYQQMVAVGCANLEAWQAVHSVKLEEARKLLMLAMMRQGMNIAWRLAAELIMELTMSPAQLFAACGDGTDYDESLQTAEFVSSDSADRFQARFPDWDVQDGGELGHA